MTAFGSGPHRVSERDRLPIGTLVGGMYAVAEAVAEGGFAALYRAVRLPDERPVALKVLHRDLAASPRIQARFRREAEVIRRLDHPRIVSVLDLGTLHDGRPYLVMEWVEGRPLSDELSTRGRLPWPEVADLAAQIAEALDAAHADGVIHRDLKADNVLVSGHSPRLSAVLVDFGLAKILADEGGEALTTASPLGTPVAMSPEQIRGQAIDTRADIYSFGVLLYQMATGRLPFAATDVAGLFDAHLHASPPSLGQLVPAPAGVEEVITSCLAKDPAGRPASAGRVAIDLCQAVGGVRTRGNSATQPAHETCVAIYVVGCNGRGSSGTQTLDRLDDLVEEARSLLLAADMSITWEIGNAILATLPAPDPARRRELLELARSLVRPDLAVYVHVGPAQLAAGRCVGGPLCAIAEWTDVDPTPGHLAVTPSALASMAG